MWQRYFRLIKLKPGRVVTALFGLIDFRNPDIPVEKIKALYENDFPYLEITPEGKRELYGVEEVSEQIEQTDFTTQFIPETSEEEILQVEKTPDPTPSDGVGKPDKFTRKRGKAE